MGRARRASLAQESPAPRGKRARLAIAVAVVGFVVAGLVVEVIFLPRAG